jgi:hypothetical protein
MAANSLDGLHRDIGFAIQRFNNRAIQGEKRHRIRVHQCRFALILLGLAALTMPYSPLL